MEGRGEREGREGREGRGAYAMRDSSLVLKRVTWSAVVDGGEGVAEGIFFDGLVWWSGLVTGW